MAATRGEAGWHAAHSEHFGQERWADLHHALHRDQDHFCFVNPFLASEPAALIREYQMRPTSIPGACSFEMPEEPSVVFRIDKLTDAHTIFVEPLELPAASDACADRPTESSSSSLSPGRQLSPFFFADGAAVIAALALQAEEGDDVLDACASLGGKALVLASSMWAKELPLGRRLRGKLVCNEYSKERAAWMQRCVRGFLPDELLYPRDGHHPKVVFTSADVRTQMSSLERHGPYDRILLDAPCTHDRGLLRSEGGSGDGAGSGSGLETWSLGKLKVSSERQVKWVYNMLWLLKEGGVVMFCSTALSPQECDGVIESVVCKASGSFQLEILPIDEHILRSVPNFAAESTDWGVRIMPDKTGCGPIYFSRLRLVKRTHATLDA